MTLEDKLNLIQALKCHHGYVEKFGIPTLMGIQNGTHPLPKPSSQTRTLIEAGACIKGCLLLEEGNIAGQEFIPLPRWDDNIPDDALERSLNYVVIHNVMYDARDEYLRINKHFGYINVIPPIIKYEIDGINIVMDYLNLLDINPDLNYKNPFTSGLLILHLEYMDLLFRAQTMIVHYINTINDTLTTEELLNIM